MCVDVSERLQTPLCARAHTRRYALEEEVPNFFLNWLQRFTFPPAVHKGSNFFVSLPTNT